MNFSPCVRCPACPTHPGHDGRAPAIRYCRVCGGTGYVTHDAPIFRCSIMGCAGKAHRSGLCEKHYQHKLNNRSKK